MPYAMQADVSPHIVHIDLGVLPNRTEVPVYGTGAHRLTLVVLTTWPHMGDVHDQLGTTARCHRLRHPRRLHIPDIHTVASRDLLQGTHDLPGHPHVGPGLQPSTDTRIQAPAVVAARPTWASGACVQAETETSPACPICTAARH